MHKYTICMQHTWSIFFKRWFLHSWVFAKRFRIMLNMKKAILINKIALFIAIGNHKHNLSIFNRIIHYIGFYSGWVSWNCIFISKMHCLQVRWYHDVYFCTFKNIWDTFYKSYYAPGDLKALNIQVYQYQTHLYLNSSQLQIYAFLIQNLVRHLVLMCRIE